MEGDFQVGAWLVQPKLNSLTADGTTAHLEPKAMQVLLYLAEHAGEVMPKERIIQAVWADTFVTDDVLTRAISELRKAFGDDPHDPHFIQTIAKSGYRLIAPVEAVPAVYDRRGGSARAERRYRRWVLALGVLLAAGLVASVVYWLLRPVPPPKLTNPVRIARLRSSEVFAGLLSDGPRVYYTDFLEDRSVIMQVPATGGEPGPIPTPFRYASAQDISPNRSELLITGDDRFDGEMPLYVLPLVGGSPRRLGDFEAIGGVWAPDGQKLLYVKGSDFYLAKSDGTESRKLVTVPVPSTWFNWSPDGRTIRFNQEDTKTYTGNIWEVSADGSNLHRFLPGWSKPDEGDAMGIWTRDGRYFLFAAYRGNWQGLWAIQEKAAFLRKLRREPVPLTQGPIHFLAPLPSVDGKKVFAIGGVFNGELSRYEARTKQFERYLSGISASEVDFSRDGQWMTYCTWPEGTLWRSRLDGSARIPLAAPPLRVVRPQWSPDGKRIAFTGQYPGKPRKIYLVSAEGGAPKQLISDELQEARPQWSSDGSQLLFGRFGLSASGPLALYLLDLRTSQVSTVPGSEGLWAPRWSPDGRYVAALGDEDRKLFLFEFKTHRRVQLATAKGGFGVANWSRDGTSICFWADLVEGKKGIFRIRLSDRKMERVASDKEVGRIWGASGDWVGLAPDDSPLVMRVKSMFDIFAFDWEAP